MQYTLKIDGRSVEYCLPGEPEFQPTHALAQSIINSHRNRYIDDWGVLYGVLTHFRTAGLGRVRIHAMVDSIANTWHSGGWSHPEYMVLIHVGGLYNMEGIFRWCFCRWAQWCTPEWRNWPITDDSRSFKNIKQLVYSTVSLFVAKLMAEVITWDDMIAMVTFYRNYDFGALAAMAGLARETVAGLEASRRDGLTLFAGQAPFCVKTVIAESGFLCPK